MSENQSQRCPDCCVLMDFVKDNTWFKCPVCGYMVRVIKRITRILNNE